MKIEMENEDLRVVVRPDLGGRIDQIRDKRSRKDWLWHPPGYDTVAERALPLGSSFDANWTGGWDEIFPNDAACSFQGRELVDHGEVWSRRWQMVEMDSHGVQMKIECATAPLTIEKTVLLHEMEAKLTVTYAVTNRSRQRIPFLLKMHPALAIEEGDKFLLPVCDVEPVELGFSGRIGRPGKTRYPRAWGKNNEEVLLNVALPRASAEKEFFYCSDLSRGECAVKNGKTNSVFRMRFAREQFPFVWVFQSFGGFGGHYVAMLEPCTTKPYDLEKACQQGTAALLEPEETRRFWIEVLLN